MTPEAPVLSAEAATYPAELRDILLRALCGPGQLAVVVSLLLQRAADGHVDSQALLVRLVAIALNYNEPSPPCTESAPSP